MPQNYANFTNHYFSSGGYTALKAIFLQTFMTITNTLCTLTTTPPKRCALCAFAVKAFQSNHKPLQPPTKNELKHPLRLNPFLPP
jgi:hypothetical protein